MSKNTAEKTPLAIHFIAGGAAGLCEALACHPLGIAEWSFANGRYDKGSWLLALVLTTGSNAIESKSKDARRQAAQLY
jgi:hypothetical protein